jgi:hypothetical protein
VRNVVDDEWTEQKKQNKENKEKEGKVFVAYFIAVFRY